MSFLSVIFFAAAAAAAALLLLLLIIFWWCCYPRLKDSALLFFVNLPINTRPTTRLQANGTVLVHAGSSGVGCAAVQLAVKANAKAVLVTAGSGEKIALCQRLGAPGEQFCLCLFDSTTPLLLPTSTAFTTSPDDPCLPFHPRRQP